MSDTEGTASRRDAGCTAEQTIRDRRIDLVREEEDCNMTRSLKERGPSFTGFVGTEIPCVSWVGRKGRARHRRAQLSASVLVPPGGIIKKTT